MTADGRLLLDTSVIIAIFSGDISVIENIISAKEIFVPCIAVGELYYGAYRSRSVIKNLNQIEEFVANSSILYCNINTTKEYGFIKNYLRENGKIIPDNDIWISAIAKQYGLILLTRDQHFININVLTKVEIL